MKRVAVALGLCLTVSVCGASAVSAKPIDGKTLAKSKRVAVSYWEKRDRRVCGPLRFRNLSMLKFTVFTGDSRPLAAAVLGPTPNGSPRCLVNFGAHHPWKHIAKSKGWTFGQLVCVVAVHEVGHTTGLRHSGSGVMRRKPRSIPRECKQAFPSPPRPTPEPGQDCTKEDPDEDGIPNCADPNAGVFRSDQCPDERGNASDGCWYGPKPDDDEDQDGVPDLSDSCQGVKGSPENGGCP